MDALIVIDYTTDFVADDGALTCGLPAQNIEEPLVDLVELFLARKAYVVLATDTHEKDDVYHPESKLFPPHNIIGSAGRAYYGQLAQIAREHPECYILNKRYYSAFAGTDLDVRLRERQIKRVHLCGVCTDICVLHTAIDAYHLGYEIVVHEKCVASFNDAGHKYALQHFKNVLGATIV